MMKKVEKIYKPVGLTPLQAIEEFRKNNPEYSGEKLSYMGRLDPMAEGQMFVLIGDENKNRDKYLNLDKEYEFEVLLGLSSDTFDILGKIKIGKSYVGGLDGLKEEINNMYGKRIQEYPPYSSPKVKGKKLFEWAREGKLEEIDIPKKEIEIYEVKILDFYNISKNELKKTVFEKIRLVKGDFRQKEILELWNENMANCKDDKFKIVKVFMKCSSGTYARSIANRLGCKIGTGAIALNIKRTKI